MEAMNEEDMYRNFGNMQAKQRKHGRIKQKLGKEYIKSKQKHIKDKVEREKNTINLTIFMRHQYQHLRSE